MNTVNVWKACCLLLMLGASLAFSGCQEDLVVPEEITDADLETSGRAIYSGREVYFSHGNGTYTSSMASSDFGNISGWDGSAYISSQTCRIRLAPNVVGTSGGMESRIDISDGDEYTLEFRIRFHSQFDWSRGGKCGWGFQMGNGVTGCRADDARNNQGGSMRLMWYTTDAGRTFFQPYLYHRGMTSNCGETFGKSYPSSGSLSKGTWYDVKMYYKANTGSSYNGIARLWINGTQVLNQTNIRWADNSNRTVRGLYYSVFRGGSQSYWGSSTVGYIYFDNLKWQKNGSSSGGGGGSLPRIQAEDYFNMSGVQTESCSEGGFNVGWIDQNDWMAWSVNVPSSGNYTIEYRVASQSGGGSLQLESYGGGTNYGSLSIPNTGGWQNWTTISHTVYLNAGTQSLAIKANSGGWNLNWWGD